MGADTIGKSHQFYELSVDDIHVDPYRFQARNVFEEDALEPHLSDVAVFNPYFAGVISVWRDFGDGRIYVVDGHGRLELARRTGTPLVLVQYLSCITAGKAFGWGILINFSQWLFDSREKIEKACACRQEALERAFADRRLDPASEVAHSLFEYFPDLKAKYGSQGNRV